MKTPNPKTWISTADMAHRLGCSRDTLRRRRTSGELKKGSHWYCLNPLAARPTYRWHEKNVKRTLGIEV